MGEKSGFCYFCLDRGRNVETDSRSEKCLSQSIYLTHPNLNFLWAEEAHCSNLLLFSVWVYP